MKWLVVLLAACTSTEVDPQTTAIDVTVHLDPSLGVDHLDISGTMAGAPAFAPGSLPGTPRPLGADESFAILLPDSLDGAQIVIRVDGLANQMIVTSGGIEATVELHHVANVDVTMGPPAVCGDGNVRDLLEGCDDGNTMSGDGCSPGCSVEPGWVCSGGGAKSCHLDTFDVVSATAISNHQIAVTFSAPPEPNAALALSSYMVPSLTLSGSPFLSGSTVTLNTSSQIATGYDVVVSNVTRASDGKPLTTTLAVFTGRASFDVMSAASTSDTQAVVTFSAPPDPAKATAAANYTIGNLTVIGTPVLAGNQVTLTTSSQSSTSYTVTVANVTRASDGEVLLATAATFTGRDGFDVAGAQSTRNRQITVTFNAPPNMAQATAVGNYNVPSLTLSNPVLNGNVVTLTTSAQMVTAYALTVSNVTRASDGSALTITSGQFAGKPVVAPLVTNVAVIATSPNNGTVPYNTGTATIRLTGTDFTSVMCPMGVRLDDRDGADGPMNTAVTSCTVDSDSQITAVLPAGIRTNGASGWSVIVTNSVGSNVTSDVPFVPRAGVLVSEVFPGSSAAPDDEFVELYNPTATSLDLGMSGLAVRLHVRAADGSDNNLPLTFVHTAVPSHGFFLIVSMTSTAADPWFPHRDATYRTMTAQLVDDGGVYLSTNAVKDTRVLDKVGWGAQPPGGYEGMALVQIPADQSAQRLPAGGAGAATDTDVNALDFAPPSAAITPLGTVDPPQP